MKCEVVKLASCCALAFTPARGSGQLKTSPNPVLMLILPFEQVVQRNATATTTVDLEIDESCCNISGELLAHRIPSAELTRSATGNAHGGFIAWLIDHASSLSLFCLAREDAWITSGVSTNINV